MTSSGCSNLALNLPSLLQLLPLLLRPKLPLLLTCTTSQMRIHVQLHTQPPFISLAAPIYLEMCAQPWVSTTEIRVPPLGWTPLSTKWCAPLWTGPHDALNNLHEVRPLSLGLTFHSQQNLLIAKVVHRKR
jgi:hypothetical protein